MRFLKSSEPALTRQDIIVMFTVPAALEEVVPEPKARSATWLSSTYAVDDESPEAALCSGAYQVILQAPHTYADETL